VKIAGIQATVGGAVYLPPGVDRNIDSKFMGIPQMQAYDVTPETFVATLDFLIQQAKASGNIVSATKTSRSGSAYWVLTDNKGRTWCASAVGIPFKKGVIFTSV